MSTLLGKFLPPITYVRASRRIYLILCLKRSDCPANLLFRACCVYIRPILLYAFTAVCNMPEYLKKKLYRAERRVLRVINDREFCSEDSYR